MVDGSHGREMVGGFCTGGKQSLVVRTCTLFSKAKHLYFICLNWTKQKRNICVYTLISWSPIE